jgi:major type 1 subunit fimbrin (pilin)
MRKIRLTLLLAMFAMASSDPAFAADANLNFTGTLVQPSCTVDTTTANQTISLGSAIVSAFPSVGSTSNPKAFNLSLLNCTPGTSVTMTVAGTMDTVASVLKNTGTATFVGVQLLKGTSAGATTGTAVSLNTSTSLGVVDATNAMTVPMVAQFYRLGTMTAGNVAATATVNFTYN